MFIVFYIINLYILEIFYLFRILLTLSDTQGSMECICICVHVCVCVCVCVCVGLCICIYIYVHIYMYVCVCMHVSTLVCEYTIRVQKKTERLLQRLYCRFYSILSTVPFKVVPSIGDTQFPTFLPLLGQFLEPTYCDGAQFSFRIFLNLLYGLETTSF